MTPPPYFTMVQKLRSASFLRASGATGSQSQRVVFGALRWYNSCTLLFRVVAGLVIIGICRRIGFCGGGWGRLIFDYCELRVIVIGVSFDLSCLGGWNHFVTAVTVG